MNDKCHTFIYAKVIQRPSGLYRRDWTHPPSTGLEPTSSSNSSYVVTKNGRCYYPQANPTRAGRCLRRFRHRQRHHRQRAPPRHLSQHQRRKLPTQSKIQGSTAHKSRRDSYGGLFDSQKGGFLIAVDQCIEGRRTL